MPANIPAPASPYTAMSPINLRRSRVISKYLRSPLLKKKIKSAHCHYCNFIAFSAENLEEHLQSSSGCSRDYFKLYKTTSLDIILISIASCLFCSIKDKFSLKPHLKTQKRCLAKYMKKFNVSTLPEVMSQVQSLKRKSRNKASRQLEYEQTKLKMKEKEMGISKIDLLNRYRKEILWTNPRLCYICHGNFSHLKAKTLQMTAEIDENPDFSKRRFEQFFICSDCEKEVVSKKRRDLESKIPFESLCESNKLFFAPALAIKNQKEQEDVLDENRDAVEVITCLFPSNIESLKMFDTKNLKQRHSDVATKIYMSTNVDTCLMSILYENQIRKEFLNANYGNLMIHGICQRIEPFLKHLIH